MRTVKAGERVTKKMCCWFGSPRGGVEGKELGIFTAPVVRIEIDCTVRYHSSVYRLSYPPDPVCVRRNGTRCARRVSNNRSAYNVASEHPISGGSEEYPVHLGECYVKVARREFLYFH